nr:hypothetical protein OG781_00395 [Streptomyces sp. NBC_00830]WTB35851.1 hypothetical protein OG781_46185 [Streptomyces sp. NBC_00830]
MLSEPVNISIRTRTLAASHTGAQLLPSNDARRWRAEPVRPADSLTGIFGEPVDVHTRAMAIEDGALIEVPADVAREAGLTFPVVLTASAWADNVAWSDEDTEPFPTSV